MRRTFLLYTLLATFCPGMQADGIVAFTASASDVVAVGNVFQVVFKIDTQKGKMHDFSHPSFDDFLLIKGPHHGYRTTYNKDTLASRHYTVVYKLLATDEGDYTIPGATTFVDSNQVVSNPVQIKVLPAEPVMLTSDDRFFVEAGVDKTSVYEKEPLLLTYRLFYSEPPSFAFSPKYFVHEGFYSEWVETSKDPELKKIQRRKGRDYSSSTNQGVLYPQHSGTVTIAPKFFRLYLPIIRKQHESKDPFTAMFGDLIEEAEDYDRIDTIKNIVSPAINIKVKALPSGRPDNFSGAVGSGFSISSSINDTLVETEDTITVTLVISGMAYMKSVDSPDVEFPEQFEECEAKVIYKSPVSGDNLSASKTIEYPAIPHTAGTFSIPPIHFSYFDVKSKRYKVLTTNSYDVTVKEKTNRVTKSRL